MGEGMGGQEKGQEEEREDMGEGQKREDKQKDGRGGWGKTGRR